MPNIVHRTSAHPRHDTRIFVKQCRSLARHGHEVALVVADGGGDELADGVRIVEVGHSRGRVRRVLHATARVCQQAVALDADVYQLRVGPRDPGAIAAAIDRLVRHPETARQMGANGRQAVLTHFNWRRESAKLITFHEQLNCH